MDMFATRTRLLLSIFGDSKSCFHILSEFAIIGCEGKGRDEVLEMPKLSMNLAIRLFLVELESIVLGRGLRWWR